MQFLVPLLAAIAGIGVLLWRMHMAAEAAKGLADTAGDVHGFFRRRRWQNKLMSDPLNTVDDPRMAATAMMAAIAQSDGALTEREHIAICQNLETHFDAKPPLNEEMLAQARWIFSENRDIDNTLRKMFNIVRAKCGPKEIAELFEMRDSVAGANGNVRDTERRALETLKRSAKS